MDELIKQWEEAARHASELTAKAHALLIAGKDVPRDLLDELASAEAALRSRLLGEPPAD
ncbi:hypothetical protein GCM10007320_61480 [Pseudorhodoferax aquiterrae]|uniref:Uncharacterized protein n=1 Tax=Pseudorhodoferax aquiterrae TaxID=747304 RepID=A0ABQ3GET9_9BURK|nr:hypothetical protein [Pseudorhodoferax aquiterrae]GHD02327.1 hypothetical protein GCM10007320_61480 [Pseudorhodoferax aquiterrae]